MLKLVLILALAVVVKSTSPPYIPLPFEAETQYRCFSADRIAGESITSLRNYIKDDADVPAEWKPYYKCVNEAFQLIDAEGAFTPRKYVEFSASKLDLQPTESEIEEAIEVLNKCENADVEDQNDRSFKIAKCVYKTYVSSVSLLKAQYH